MFYTVFVCFSDGVIKTWESESGKLVTTAHEHKGWITDFLYWYCELLTLNHTTTFWNSQDSKHLHTILYTGSSLDGIHF